jgi:hypothetical protein|tara:strand:- start:8473 stop:8760 length:288 start_codon:yes stop_codon:yes gene_type:complete
MFTFKKKQIQVSGQKIDVRELSAGGFRKFNNAIADEGSDELMQMAILMQQGTEQFKSMSEEEILDQVPMDVINQIVPEIVSISGLDEEGEEEKKD